MLFSLQAKLIAAILLAVFIAGVYWRGHTQGWKARDVIAQADAAAQLEKALQAEQKARAVEVELQGKAAAIRRTKDAQIHSLGLELSESLQRLRNRPERPAASDVPAVAGTGGNACTGAELYKPDAEFLVGLAASADRLRIALQSCQAAYKAARAVK